MIPRLELLLSAYMIVAGVSRTEGLAAALQATKKDQLVLERAVYTRMQSGLVFIGWMLSSTSSVSLELLHSRTNICSRKWPFAHKGLLREP